VGPDGGGLPCGGSVAMSPSDGGGHGARSTRAAASCAVDLRSSRGGHLPR
jgi:hypothetical protein